MRTSLFQWTLALAALLHAASALADGGDVVLLKNGGRVRGAIVIEDPVTGVRVRLADGTVRNVAAADVQSVIYEGQAESASPPPVVAPPPVAPPPVVVAPPPVVPGFIHVETEAPATVSVDGNVVGKAPVDVRDVPPGDHTVRADFDGEGPRSVEILVQPGLLTKVTLPRDDYYRAFDSHQGLHFGVVADTSVVAYDVSGIGTALGGGSAGALAQYGVSPAVDLRGAVFLGAAGGAFSIGSLGAAADLGFNVVASSVMSVGLRGGLSVVGGSNGATLAPFVGPELSLVGFRFGAQRQLSVALSNRLLFSFITDDSRHIAKSETLVSVETAVSFAYLFVGKSSPKPTAAP
jgi:hypothetical protein